MKLSIASLRRGIGLAAFVAAALTVSAAARQEAKPSDPYFEKFQPAKAPAPGRLLLRPGDRLAIVGDSITEQKMYSRLMETYLAVCVPELNISVRQFGWSGETAEGFRRRMTNDCLRFQPTIATFCYGMNDYKYRPYDEANARWYRSNYTAVARAFKDSGARVVLGSPGCVGKVASWVKSASGTLEEHNLHLCALRNIDIEIAAAEKTAFADVFWPMLTAGYAARKQYGGDYAVAGKDGVHPGWAGQLIMAHAYLRAMGLDGDLGTITVNLKTQKATGTKGHVVDRISGGEITLTSRRYPFCASGELNSDDSIRSGMTLVPFNRELNRLTLVAKGAAAKNYRVTWGAETKVFSARQLAKGVNLADEFAVNPFSEAFKKVDEAVAAKQAYETRQIKQAFHSAEAKADMASMVAKTEAERAPLAQAIAAGLVPVTHTIRLEPQ
jgi:lysophospholipase L1-like esterase